MNKLFLQRYLQIRAKELLIVACLLLVTISFGGCVAGDIETLQNNDDIGQRNLAAINLNQSKDPRAVEALITALQNDESASVRRTAANSLGALKEPRAVGPLINALKDQNGSVRSEAASALSGFADQHAIAPLIVAADDSELEVRDSAIFSLGKLGGEQAFDAILAIMQKNATEKDDVSKNKFLLKRICSAFGDIGAEEIERLITASIKGDRSDRSNTEIPTVLYLPIGDLPYLPKAFDFPSIFLPPSNAAFRIKPILNRGDIDALKPLYIILICWKESDHITKWQYRNAAYYYNLSFHCISAYNPDDLHLNWCEAHTPYKGFHRPGKSRSITDYESKNPWSDVPRLSIVRK